MRKLILALVFSAGCLGAPATDNVGGYRQRCHPDGTCDAQLTCAEDSTGAQYCLPLERIHCGAPGEPCCKSYEQDGHNIAQPCLGSNQCRFYCYAGFRCDGSHATGDVNVCTPE